MIKFLFKTLVFTLLVCPVLASSKSLVTIEYQMIGTNASGEEALDLKLSRDKKQSKIKKQGGARKQPRGKKQTGAKKPPVKKPEIKEVPKSKRQLKPSAVKGKVKPKPAKVHKPKIRR